jgi:TonB family protein
LEAKECFSADLILVKEGVLIRRLLAPLVLLNSFTYAQTLSAHTYSTPSDPQQTSSMPVKPVAGDPIPTEADVTRTAAGTPALEKIGHGVSAPVPVSTPQAKYSREARKKKIQGDCLVQVIVDAQGLPQNPRIVAPIGYGLDAAAVDAIKKYRFKPAMKDGHPVSVQMAIKVTFRLY